MSRAICTAIGSRRELVRIASAPRTRPAAAVAAITGERRAGEIGADSVGKAEDRRLEGERRHQPDGWRQPAQQRTPIGRLLHQRVGDREDCGRDKWPQIGRGRRDVSKERLRQRGSDEDRDDPDGRKGHERDDDPRAGTANRSPMSDGEARTRPRTSARQPRTTSAPAARRSANGDSRSAQFAAPGRAAGRPTLSQAMLTETTSRLPMRGARHGPASQAGLVALQRWPAVRGAARA